jgi:CO/xanthine dehydrogenase FAD-binding subunit
MVMLGAGTLKAKKLVSLWGLKELRFIRETTGMMTVGAGTTYTDIRRSNLIAEEFPLLMQAAGWTGSIANQNRGTLGGNIVNASPAADSPPALLAYGAELVVGSIRGERTVPYTEFHLGYKKTALAMDELLLAVMLPRRFEGYFQSSRKVGARRAQAISKVAMAMVAKLNDGVVADIAIGGASLCEIPMRCTATEQALLGRRLDAPTIAAAQASLAGEIAPIDDIRSTAKYRAYVARNLLNSMLVELST